MTERCSVAPMDRRPIPSEGALCRVLDEQAVILHLDTGTYYSLNAVGTEIWGRLDGASTVADLVRFVCETYDVEPDRGQQDVLELLDDLSAEGLIVLEAGPPVATDRSRA
jgi:hypothetical protein